MTIEAGLIGKKRRVMGHDQNQTLRKKKCCKRPKVVRAPRERSVTLQKLFLGCKDAFKGPGTVPSPDDVQMLQHILDKMKPEDIGLHSDLLFFNHINGANGSPSVTYTTTIYQCKNFSLSLFFLPKDGIIPLHNHPGMTVFSKLLVGSMHIKSYDWIDQDHKSDDPALPTKPRLARLKTDKVFSAPCDTSILYPTTGGNIHEFRAVTPCAVLDVLGPPYSSEDGRDCTYYRDLPYSSISGGTLSKEQGEEKSYQWLEEIETPKESNMEWIEYRGPQITEMNPLDLLTM
ncbi:hypothetical protein Scep_003566 [Stephania cephalantha]|uniref:cysteine dioxygenase n=1 Tax=Stephania cephalantha TaxID=152367 RepID=A0AAP0KSR0_9MAGN